MTELKITPMPEGHELRLKRALKADKGSEWLPEDAFYDAQVGLKEQPPVGALIIAWMTPVPDGKGACKLCYRVWNENMYASMALAMMLAMDLATPKA
jgi:hypothetical protein